jgi:hypothetical protein
MPYQLVLRTTFKEPGSPTFDRFIDSIDPSILEVDFPGLTPREICNRYRDSYEKRPGFVSRTFSEDELGETVTFVNDLPMNVPDAVYLPPFSIAVDPLNETPMEALRLLYATRHLSKVEVTVTEI